MKEVLLTLFYYSALVDIGDGFLLHNIQIVRHAALVSSWDFSACKVSASDILQGHGAALARIFFSRFWGTVAPGPNSRSAKGEKIFGYLLP